MRKFYRENNRALKWGIYKFLKEMLILPIIIFFLLWSIVFCLNYCFDAKISIDGISWNKDALTYISWFLFAWLTILLSNTTFNQKEQDIIRKKYKGYICEYWNLSDRCENTAKIQEGIEKWITKFKFSLLLDVLFLVIIAILLICLSLFTFKYLKYFTAFFLVYYLIQIYFLFWRMISYLKVVNFSLK